jgi:thioredoxin-related protein
MKINKSVIIAVALTLSASQFLDAKVRAVMARRDFEQTISKGSMVVVLFYQDAQNNRNMRDQNKGLMRMYEDVSGYRPYDDADIIFLKVNSNRKDLADLAALYGVTAMPTFIFFNNGRRLVDTNGSAIELAGFVSRVDLQSFIDMRFGSQMKQYVANKEDRRQNIIEQENESWKPYFYPRDMVVRGYAPEERQKNME